MATTTGDRQKAPVSGAAKLLNLFATPVAKIPCPFADEINDELSASVLDRMRTGVKELSFKSETIGNLTDWDDPEADRLTSWVLSMARTFVETVRREPLHQAVGAASPEDVRLAVLRSWASVYRGGDHHAGHFHPNTAISAVYYVASAGPCDLELTDPRANVEFFDPGITFAGEGQTVRMRCGPGILLLFPGWLKHAVPSYEGSGVRISIAWNLAYSFGANVALQPAGG
ncbi:uncharacterized protein (TIGR02466 family) [Streptomyces sp. 846.5]|nr:TIGR02466 family protein [Streptomyces sp. 846.5]TDU02348.1 uncharacterized protein (TIGR02466 family) [Streptomyces sp. 846.5]